MNKSSIWLLFKFEHNHTKILFGSNVRYGDIFLVMSTTKVVLTFTFSTAIANGGSVTYQLRLRLAFHG